VAAGLAERFEYVQVVGPLERMRFVLSLEGLLELGLAERVCVGERLSAGWHYRLTPAGVEAAKSEDPGAPPKKGRAKKLAAHHKPRKNQAK
jgi:hypothetical protein